MAERQVTCITKPHRENVHEHITHIGNIGDGWRLTRESAIAAIDNQTLSFFTVDAYTGKRAYVAVVKQPGRAPYLRTHADGKWNDNLLAQRECGETCRLVA